MTNEELIQKAASVINSKKVGEFTIGNVGCALLTDKGNLYLGVCIDISSGMGFCAERNAIGSMITNREYRVKKIVGVWKDEKGDIYVLSPCGACREFIKQINKENLETDVILSADKIVKLKDLLPYYDWWNKTQF